MKFKRLVKIIFPVIFLAGLTVNLASVFCWAADNVPRISIQELKAKMDSGEKIIILDVRSGGDYQSSKVKITGSIRIPIDQISARSKDLPEGVEIITYCA